MNKHDPFSIGPVGYDDLHLMTPNATESLLLPVYKKRFNDVC